MKDKIESFILALSLCIVSIVILLGGMNIGAMQSNRSEEVYYDEQNTAPSEDIIASVIDEFSEESLREEFAGVNILTWDQYYELSGQTVREEQKRGVYGTINQENCSMEWAALMALKELTFIENIDMTGMYMMMVLSDATSSQALDIWRGYLCNFLEGQEPINGERREYYIKVNAYTGEILRIEKRGDTGTNRTLLDNSNKLDVTNKDMEIDYSAVPVMSVSDYLQIKSIEFEEDMETYHYGTEGYISMEEASDLILKEIHRLFNEDMLGMKLVMSLSDGKWGGWLLNDYAADEKEYKSYSFRMDARSGKIWWLTGTTNTHSYTKKTAVTDAEIIENARSIIKKYHLANVDKVNWNKVTVANASKDIVSAIQRVDTGKADNITNSVEFYSDDGELVQISTDWETGELWMVLYKDYLYYYR